MRTEQEMLQLITNFASNDERIRAIWLNGSRANPAAPKDIYMDFDAVCAVTEVSPYVADKTLPDRFGTIAVMQEPDPPNDERYAYLMQFTDVNRIDLSFVRLDIARKEYGKDSQTILLLDKDNRLPPLPPPSDRNYRVQKPTAQEFAHTVNEFCWVAPYVAKGIKRQEHTYAQEQLNRYVRPELIRMLSVKAALPHDFTVSTGKCGKYLSRYLSAEEYEQLLSTYCRAEAEDEWRALLAAYDLFERTAEIVAAALDYPSERGQIQKSLHYVFGLKHL